MRSARRKAPLCTRPNAAFAVQWCCLQLRGWLVLVLLGWTGPQLATYVSRACASTTMRHLLLALMLVAFQGLRCELLPCSNAGVGGCGRAVSADEVLLRRGRCQHGPRECELNRVLNCAQELSSNQVAARGASCAAYACFCCVVRVLDELPLHRGSVCSRDRNDSARTGARDHPGPIWSCNPRLF